MEKKSKYETIYELQVAVNEKLEKEGYSGDEFYITSSECLPGTTVFGVATDHPDSGLNIFMALSEEELIKDLEDYYL